MDKLDSKSISLFFDHSIKRLVSEKVLASFIKRLPILSFGPFKFIAMIVIEKIVITAMEETALIVRHVAIEAEVNNQVKEFSELLKREGMTQDEMDKKLSDLYSKLIKF